MRVQTVAVGLAEFEARCAAAGLGADGGKAGWRLAVPLWFDAAIGYWTGEPDWEALLAALGRLVFCSEASEVAVAGEREDASPRAWLPSGGRPGPRLMIRGPRGAWVAQIASEATVFLAASSDETLLLLRRWAEEERLELTEERGG